MSKFIKIAGCISAIFIIFIFIPDTNRSIFARFFKNHNIGEIFLSIDGNEIKLDNIDITLTCENSENTQKIKNGKFKFREGDYGKNIFNFEIPAEIYKGQIDIVCKVQYNSSNNWHVNNFNINISITTDRGITKIYGDGFVTTKNEKEPHFFDAFFKEIKEGDNTIFFNASGI